MDFFVYNIEPRLKICEIYEICETKNNSVRNKTK